MTALRLTYQVARLKLLLWRLIATRAALRLVRRAVDWLVRRAVDWLVPAR
jgi:hypothetical protein